jgi:RimJ/RimL family protein N-acetyltransferase
MTSFNGLGGRLAGRFRSRAGRSVAIRRAGPEDVAAIAAMIGDLSARTVERRYLTPRTLSGEAARREAERLTRREAGRIVLVAQEHGAGRIVAVAELVADRAERHVAEGAVVVADAYQGEGIGRAVVQQMAAAAEGAAISRVRATTHASNTPVRRLIASCGRPYTARFAGAEVQYEVALA